MFQDEQFMNEQAKNEVLADWNRFIHGGFQRGDFTNPLYQYLVLQCGFSAHTNQAEFWEYYCGSTAANLAVFFNQFGGSKVSAETRWLDWRSGNTSDLKEALIALAKERWPDFESVLTGYAQERYEAEKWMEAQRYLDRLPKEMWNAQSLSHMSLIFELTFPFEVYLDCLPVDDELRRRLAGRSPVRTTDLSAPATATALAPQWSLNGRMAQVVQVRQTPLFEATPAQTEAQASLAKKVADLAADLSTADALVTAHTSSAPVVIEGQKALYKEN